MNSLTFPANVDVRYLFGTKDISQRISEVSVHQMMQVYHEDGVVVVSVTMNLKKHRRTYGVSVIIDCIGSRRNYYSTCINRRLFQGN